MGSTSKSLKRNDESLFGNEEEENEKMLAKKSKFEELKSLPNAIIVEDCKGPPSPASLPPLDGRKPAEVFRTDLISAMKVPDYHVLSPETYITITDQWRQEWERGVQVPVNPEGLHQPSCRVVEVAYKKLPNFKIASQLVSSETRTRTKNKCPYNLNRMDVEWLMRFNKSRRNRGNFEVEENILEKAIAYLENKCYDNMGHAITTQDGLSIEFDEDVCCDVCQSPDAEELNEMVFCDSCDICVHQACYGIRNIPPGSYLCHPCRKRTVSPRCLLCPNTGGAMKRTKSGKDWVHVSCALWVPEVGFGDVEKMEPVTRIENIPASRWNLVCVLCREKVGASIQCSVKSCVTAFHVTCGFKNGLEMKTVLDDAAADGVRHISYCTRHGHKSKSPCRSPEKERQTKDEKETMRQKKLRQMEEEFHTFINVAEAAKDLNLPKETMSHVHSYWTLKRKAQYDVPLLPPTLQQQEKLSGKQVSADLRLQHQMEKFVRLRHDLERLRNLCYMVNRREKTRRELYRAQEQVFWKQVEILTDDTRDPSKEDLQWVIEAGRGNFSGNGSSSPGGGSKSRGCDGGSALWSSANSSTMSNADGNSESGSSTEQSNSQQKSETGNSQEGTSGNGGTNDDVVPHSADESDVDEGPTPAFGPSPVRESRRCSRAEETKAVSVEDSRCDDLTPYPATPSPGHRTRRIASSTGKSSTSSSAVESEGIGSPLAARRITRHEVSAKKSRVPSIIGDGDMESDAVLSNPSPVGRTKRSSQVDVTFSPGRLTRKNYTNEELLSLPYYAKSPRKKSVGSPPMKQEKETESNQTQSPARKPSKVFIESPIPQLRFEALGLPENPGLECVHTTQGDKPVVEANRRRTRSTSDAFVRGSDEPIAEVLLKTPERVLRNRRQGNPSPDNELSPNVSTTPLSSRKRKFESTLGSLESARVGDSPEANKSKKAAVTPSRRTPKEERLSDEEFPKENEPMSPRSKSPKRMRITADNEVVQEALERGFDPKRLRSNANFGEGDVFLNTQSMVENQRQKQSRITEFLPAKPGCRIKSPKEIHRMKSRYRNNKTARCTSRSCSQMPPNHIKNGNHAHSPDSCPDCKIHREKYDNVSPQGQHKHAPSHADRWNGIITRRDLGLRPLDSSSASGPCYAAPGLSRSSNCCNLIAKFCSPTVS